MNLLEKIWQLIFGKPKEVEKPAPLKSKQAYRVFKPKKLTRKTKRWNVEKCVVMDKFMFTREQAEEKKEEHMRKSGAEYLRIYPCQFCNFWHLTHKKS